MIRSLRASFLARALREKLLLLTFIGIGVVWWGSTYAKRGAQFWREQRTTTAKLRDQQVMITNRPLVEQRAQQAAGRLDPAKTLNANQLAAAVHQLAQESGLRNNYRTDPTMTTSGTQFLIHSLKITIQGADWEKQITPFYIALQKRAPYIAIESFTLQSAPNNDALLTLLLTVSSVEINR